MSLPPPAGLFVPVTTPFRESDGEVDDTALASNITALLEAGADGIVANGTTGEAALLTPNEQRHVVAVARAVVPSGRWLVSGTGAESTRDTITATHAAAEAGADAVMVRAPAYYGASLSPAALERHFREVAEASPVPVFLYNIPKYTHFSVPSAVVAALSGHPRIVGLKDSSGELAAFEAYRAAAPGWRLFIGSLAHVVPAVDRGAVGGILAAGCFMAAHVARLLTAARTDDRATSAPLAEQLAPVAREVVGRLGVPGIKWAMDCVGLVGGRPRPPLLPLSEAEGRRVTELVAAVNGTR